MYVLNLFLYYYEIFSNINFFFNFIFDFIIFVINDLMRFNYFRILCVCYKLNVYVI